MAFFGDLFGKRKPAPAAPPAPAPTPAPAPASAPAQPAAQPENIRVFDAYGREMLVSRQDWVDKVLAGALQKEWKNCDRLAGLITQALQDRFFQEMVEPAEHLREIDTNKERSATLLAVTYLNVKRFADAEHIRAHGETGNILTNLAKAYSAEGHEKRSHETLWHGLELDPNQANGLAWYEAIHRERQGPDAGTDALRRIAALPASWRAQLWLARQALRARQLDAALDYYRESLARAGTPVPVDLLTQMSGDLGNNGHLPELITWTEPRFDPALHGLQVGNNLIKAHIDLGQIDEARRILDSLYALKRPDWNKSLSFWDTEIAKVRVASDPVGPAEPLQLAMLRIEGPVWLKPASPATELFRAKPAGAPLISFLGASAETPAPSDTTQRQMADAPGRISRALPLFFAEQVHFCTEANVRTLVPWIAAKSPGFVLSGRRWEDAEAAGHARAEEPKADYIVLSHIDAKTETWTLYLKLVRTIDAKSLAELTATFPFKEPETAIPAITRQLLDQLAVHAELRPEPASDYYDIPTGPQFPYYLLRLEQLLAARCGAMDGVPKNFLSGEREIINGNIQNCLANPRSLPARLVLLQTFIAIAKPRPEIVGEFRDKLLLLQKEKPLPEPAHSIIQRLLNESLGAEAN
jgi:tetratricopeptide (TPR) repeat protein